MFLFIELNELKFGQVKFDIQTWLISISDFYKYIYN